MTDQEMLAKLDAYGHLTWTVGNEDWLACLDFIVEDDKLAYHVVVDCESAGWMETPEEAVIPRADWEQIAGLADRYASLCEEVGGGVEDHEELARTVQQWKDDLRKAAQ